MFYEVLNKLKALFRHNKGEQLSRNFCQLRSWQGSCKSEEESENIKGSSVLRTHHKSHSNIKELILEVMDGVISTTFIQEIRCLYKKYDVLHQICRPIIKEKIMAPSHKTGGQRRSCIFKVKIKCLWYGHTTFMICCCN